MFSLSRTIEPLGIFTNSKAILSVADLETVTVKKIRRALSELYSINLDEQKVCTIFKLKNYCAERTLTDNY